MSNSTRQSLTFDGITHLLGGSEQVWLDPPDGGSVTGYAGANNALYGGGGATLTGGGGGGDNNFYVLSPFDTVVAQADDGVDTVISWTSTYLAPEGVDNVVLQVAGAIAGNTGDNVIIAQGGNGAIPYGGPGQTGTVTFTHTLYDGGGGNDVFIGSDDANDRYVVTKHEGHSAIVNYQAGVDLIELDGTSYTSFAQVQQHLTQDGADAVLDLGDGQTLRLVNVAASDLKAGDFALPFSAAGLTLTFDENFDSFSASPLGNGTVWRTSFGIGNDWSYRSLPSNSELGYYSDSSVGANPFIDTDGVLSIHAAVATTPNADNLPVTTGTITTAGSFSQQYGYFEMRAELPGGSGAWPCFWLMPTNGQWPPELDIFEVIGSDPDAVHMTVHTEDTGSHTAVSQISLVDNLSAGYHTYAVDWEPDYITFYVDGNQVAKTITPDDMKQPMYILASYAIGANGSWAGGADLSGLPDDYKIDYIRAYASANTINLSQTPAVQAELAANGTAYLPGSTLVGTQSAGTGANTLVLKVAQDAYGSDAQFTVAVDGQQVGGTFATAATHALGQYDSIVLHGNWGTGAHQVTVSFLNDDWGGTVDTDRNLYVDGAAIDGTAVAGASLALNNTGASSFSFAAAAAAVPGTTLVGSQSVGTGSDTLVLKVSEDAGQGDAQFTVSVDGHQVGGTLTAHAANSAGAYETIAIAGDWAPGAHQVTVSFLDASDATGLHVLGAAIDGTDVAGGSTLDLARGGAGSIAFTDTTVVTFAAQEVGSGSDTLALRVSEDAWQGDAQFIVKVDGVQVGGTLTAQASRAAGEEQTFNVHGNWAAGAHQVEVDFLNDAWDGAAGDRNLYVEGASLNGTTVAGASLALMSNGGQNFSVTDTTAVPTGLVGTQTVGSGAHAVVLQVAEDAFQGDAQFTVSIDGQQVGGVLTAHAAAAAGQYENIVIRGDNLLGASHLSVNFLNDAYDSTTSGDRNLYVLSNASYDGVGRQITPMNLLLSGSQDVTPVAGSAGLLLHVSEDAFQGDAQFTVAVDGVQQGGVYTVTALHAAGQTQDVALTGAWADGRAHTLQVSFLNDASGPNGDRNLYIDGFDVASSTSAVTHHDGTALWWAQTVTFDHVSFG